MDFPLATLLVNVIGSVAMGLLIGALARTLPPWQTESAAVPRGRRAWRLHHLLVVLARRHHAHRTRAMRTSGALRLLSVVVSVIGLYCRSAGHPDGAGVSGVRQQVVARDEDGMRLDRWFATHFPQVTFGHLQKLIRTGQVRVDSGRVKTNTRLEAGQVVRVPPVDAAPEKSEAQGSIRTTPTSCARSSSTRTTTSTSSTSRMALPRRAAAAPSGIWMGC